MKIDIKIPEIKHLKKEIELPYYAKDVCYFIMITKSETAIRINPGEGVLSQDIELFSAGDVCYDQILNQAVTTAHEISELEFIEQYDNVINKIIREMGIRNQYQHLDFIPYNPEDLQPVPEIDPLP